MADLVVVAPATADLMAKLAGGHADDLASARAPCHRTPRAFGTGDEPAHVGSQGDAAQPCAADPRTASRWSARTRARWPRRARPASGVWPSPLEIVAAALPLIAHAAGDGALASKRVIVTSGPTHEPIDPVRYIANRSSGKQGQAIAAAARLRAPR